VKDADEVDNSQLMVHYVPELLKHIPPPTMNMPLGWEDTGRPGSFHLLMHITIIVVINCEYM